MIFGRVRYLFFASLWCRGCLKRSGGTLERLTIIVLRPWWAGAGAVRDAADHFQCALAPSRLSLQDVISVGRIAGAVTLALALSDTINASIRPAVQIHRSFATGFF